MKIAIIGSGNVGGALAQSLLKAGHTVLIGAKFPLSEKSIRLATAIGEDRFAVVERAAAAAEVIIITTPPETVIDLIPQLGNTENKIIIDTTNSVRTKPEGYATVYHALKDKTGNDNVVKCFNTTGFENMLNPIYHGEGIDMFCAGNSSEAKKIASQLAKDIGFAHCYDFGGDDKVELLEKFALSWINLAIMQGMGRAIAFKLVKR
jgi:predicted dinucleotide-binding enzyme